MLDVIRRYAGEERRRLVAFARRNPLTILGFCLGLLLAIVAITRVENRIGDVNRTVVKLSTCTAKPYSRTCLRSITRGVKRCLADPACHNLIAGANVIAVRPPASADSPPSTTHPPPTGTSQGTSGVTSQPPKTEQPQQGSGKGGDTGTDIPGDIPAPAEPPQEPPGGPVATEPAPEAAKPPDAAPASPTPTLKVCANVLLNACAEVPHLQLGL